MIREHPEIKSARHQMLLTDVTRAALRGWPIEPPLERCRAAGLKVVGAEAFA
jgi:hypothetical protein